MENEEWGETSENPAVCHQQLKTEVLIDLPKSRWNALVYANDVLRKQNQILENTNQKLMRRVSDLETEIVRINGCVDIPKF